MEINASMMNFQYSSTEKSVKSKNYCI